MVDERLAFEIEQANKEREPARFLAVYRRRLSALQPEDYASVGDLERAIAEARRAAAPAAPGLIPAVR